MSAILVRDLVLDYCALNIRHLYQGEKNRVLNGLLRILANKGVEIDLSDPNLGCNKVWKKLLTRYSRIVEKIEYSLSRGREKFGQFNDDKLASVFFSSDEFSSLLKAEKEPR